MLGKEPWHIQSDGENIDLNNEAETTVATQYKEDGPTTIKAGGYYSFSTRINLFHTDEHHQHLFWKTVYHRRLAN